MRTLREDDFGDDGERDFDAITERLGIFGTDADVLAYGAFLLQSPEELVPEFPKQTESLPYLNMLFGQHVTFGDAYRRN